MPICRRLSTVLLFLIASAASAAAQSYETLPLSFEANRGQSDSRVAFLSRGDGYAVYLTGTGATLELGKGEQAQAVRMSISGASRVRPQPLDPLLGKVNYLIGKDPSQWHLDLPTYARVSYPALYPGVDLVYYGNQRQLEYDFVVAPGGRTGQIRLHFAAPGGIKLTADGELMLGTAGIARLRKPTLYQTIDGQRRNIDGGYVLLAGRSVGFRVGRYDRTKPLVIDPVLVYSTYLGGTGNARGNGIALDADGSAYVVGQALLSTFPVTAGALPTPVKANAANPSVVVTKFNADGSALVYSTYLGGSGADVAYGIALDSANNAYITGSTGSTDFPVTCGAFQPVNRSPTDAATAFVAKLNAGGDAIVYATYLGGTGRPASGDVGQAIAVDAGGYAYVTGYTSSTDFPVTNGALQSQNRNSTGDSHPTAFVTKLNADGTALTYSTYLGGSGSASAGDYGNAIAVNGSGNAYVTGNTGSLDFPITAGAFQTINNGADFNDASSAFVTELNPAGTQAVYSTFLGGSVQDTAYAIALDTAGNAYVGGATQSYDFPTTWNAVEGVEYGTLTESGNTGFVTKLNPTGTAAEFSTFLGGTGLTVSGLAVDANGVIYATGTSLVSGFSSFADALPAPPSSPLAAFVIKLRTDGIAINYATLVGSSGSNASVSSNGNAVAVDASGNVYITGYTDASDFPTSSGAYQRTNHATATPGTNSFVTKLALAGETANNYPADPPPRTETDTELVYGSFIWIDCPNSYYADSTAQVESLDGGFPTGSVNISTFWNSTTVPLNGDQAYASWIDPNTDHHVSEGDEVGVDANYLGNGHFAPSNVIRHLSAPYCEDIPFVTGGGRQKVSALLPLGPERRPGKKHSSLGWQAGRQGLFAFGPKFVPELLRAQHKVRSFSSSSRIVPQDAGGTCTVPSLKVVLHPVSRFYGSPNPPAVATFTPSLNQNTLTVTDTVAADANSPVGLYPLTASVSGPSAANYSPITVTPTTLKVKPVVLGVVADSQRISYGQAPSQPAGYSFVGFVNGENASVVSGAPVLSTNVTATTPPGYYNIQIALGTLSATNYIFTPFVHPGVVHVDKAPLTVKPDAVSMPVGGPIPALTYSFTGFVNGESAAATVTGTPVLRTTATTHSAPGTYPIYISTGSLKSNNYRITAVAGVLTITP